MTDSAPVTTALAQYITGAADRPLPHDVLEKTKQHFFDTMVAMLSGATLKPGRLAVEYARTRGGQGQATLAGTTERTNPELASLANGMCAHADETDDVNDLGRIHPGAAVVPAALAMAETDDRGGKDLLSAIAVGYDVGVCVNIGAWETFPLMNRDVHASHGVGETFGAMAAAASLAQLSDRETAYALSYAAQQVSGIATFYRDQHHIGKAFATAAMEAHAGVRAVELVRAGFTDIEDVFDDSPNAYDAFGINSDPQRLLRALGSTHHVMTTDIKRFPIGGPIQASAEALETLINAHGLTVDDVNRVEAHVPSQHSWIVDNRSMPDISLQYILSVLLVDGTITFDNSHDYARHNRPEMRQIMEKIQLIPEAELNIPQSDDATTRRTRRAYVVVHTHDGRSLTERVDSCLGSSSRPMTWDQLATKAHSVLGSVMAIGHIDELIALSKSFESASTRDLRPFLAAPSASSLSTAG